MDYLIQRVLKQKSWNVNCKLQVNKVKNINAREFFKAVIKNGDNSLLADLKIITAKLQQIAADIAAISPKYV